MKINATPSVYTFQHASASSCVTQDQRQSNEYNENRLQKKMQKYDIVSDPSSSRSNAGCDLEIL